MKSKIIKKRIIIIICFIILIFAISIIIFDMIIPCTLQIKRVSEQGNSNSNIHNGGNYIIKDDWIYYTNKYDNNGTPTKHAENMPQYFALIAKLDSVSKDFPQAI